jgi:hypothetical protein
MLPDLEKLWLIVPGDNPSSRELGALAQMTRLRHLQLSMPSNTSPTGIACLSALTNLTTLEVWVTLKDNLSGLRALALLPTLTHVTLDTVDDLDVDDDAIAALRPARLLGLGVPGSYLRVGEGDLDDIDFSRLTRLVARQSDLWFLTHEDFEGFTDDDLVALAQNAPLLEELDICGCKRVTDDGIQALAPLPIRRVWLEGCSLTDFSLMTLASPNLCELSWDAVLGAAGLHTLSTTRGLIKLKLVAASATQSAIDALQSLPELATLHLDPRTCLVLDVLVLLPKLNEVIVSKDAPRAYRTVCDLTWDSAKRLCYERRRRHRPLRIRRSVRPTHGSIYGHYFLR